MTDRSEHPNVKCPNCGKEVPWIPESHYRPFCSKRCKMADLGDWLSEEHRIPGENAALIPPDDLN